MSDDREPLAVYLAYLDSLTALVGVQTRPAYAETCVCGSSVEVGREVSRADLRRIHANFLGRHVRCVRPIVTISDPAAIE